MMLIGFEPQPAEVQAQSIMPFICITEPPDAVAYPDIRMNFRVYDYTLNSVAGVSSGLLGIEDNGALLSPLSLTSNEKSLGLDIYFAIDQGNRTDQTIVKAAIARFAEKFMLDGKDRVTIVTNLDDFQRLSPRVILPYTSSAMQVLDAVNELPEHPHNYFLSPYEGIKEAYNLIRAETSGCSRPKVVIALMGGEALSDAEISSLITEAKILKVPVHVAQTKKYQKYNSSAEYYRLASGTYGLYAQIELIQNSEFTLLDPGIYNWITNTRLSYTLTYRTVEGSTGEHGVMLSWLANMQNIETNMTSYSVAVMPPQVKMFLTDGVIIERRAVQYLDGKYLYDTDTQPLGFRIEWVDGYPRGLITAELLVQTITSTESISVMTPTDLNALVFDFDLKNYTQEGDTPLVLQIKVADELGYTGYSDPFTMTVRNIIPPEVIPTPIPSPTPEVTALPEEESAIAINPAALLDDPNFLKYLLIGLVALLVVVILIIIIRKATKRSRADSNERRNKVKEAKGVRKTTVGGVRRGMPLATLKVIDGPTKMIGEELRIFTESIKLGRDPQLADYTFYQDSNSSISGLHAKIERVNGEWRVVAVSKSGNETFIDGAALPMMEPVPVQNGQVIRLGYLGQQAVELEFNALTSSAMRSSAYSSSRRSGQSASGARKTKVDDSALSSDFAPAFESFDSHKVVRKPVESSVLPPISPLSEEFMDDHDLLRDTKIGQSLPDPSPLQDFNDFRPLDDKTKKNPPPVQESKDDLDDFFESLRDRN